MSDPVTNAEIEDVLSSIRRLVSEEPLGDRAARQEQADNTSKLVLTPALRVADPEEQSGEAPEAAAESADVEDAPEETAESPASEQADDAEASR